MKSPSFSLRKIQIHAKRFDETRGFKFISYARSLYSLFNYKEIETRDDVLVYTSEPLKNGFEVTGFIDSTIYLSSDTRNNWKASMS